MRSTAHQAFLGHSLYVNRMRLRVGFLVMVTDRRVTLPACGR
ncbi:hypothetical protein AB0C38_20110 [Amycolatopsis sp. NPDC048633]